MSCFKLFKTVSTGIHRIPNMVQVTLVSNLLHCVIHTPGIWIFLEKPLETGTVKQQRLRQEPRTNNQSV